MKTASYFPGRFYLLQIILFSWLWLFAAPMTGRATSDYGPAVARFVGCGKYYTSGYTRRLVVIHDMEGYYLTAIAYLNRCDLNASGNYNVAVSVNYAVNGLKDNSTDAARGEISQLVSEAYYAWHAGCWNLYSVGTEHEGFASNPAWYTEEMYQSSSLLQRHFCDKFGIAKDRNHVIAHGQKLVAGWSAWADANLPAAFDPNCNTHTDPGPYWDWNHFMALIIGGTDDAAFVSKTLADNTTFAPNQAFSCTWTMNNNGTLTWIANGANGYSLNNYAGTAMGAPFATDVAGNIAPGANATFPINFTAPAAPGTYTVNFQMNNSSFAYFGQQVALTIKVATPGPTITTQPTSQTVNPGATVQFNVAATGSGALSYQWRKEGVNLSNGGKISGATTATLTISNVQQTEVGNYNVIVTDTKGSNPSLSAALAVNTVVAFFETFESGNLNNWGTAITTATPAATPLDISTAQNHTSGGTYSGHVDNALDRMYRNIGAKIAGRGLVTFWIYDSAQTRAFAEVRSYSGNSFNSGTLDQLLAVGKYSSVTMAGEDGTVSYVNSHYQGRIVSGPQTGWFNLNASGAPGRSAGWHEFKLERLADQSTVKWYVDGVLSRTFTGMTSPGWDSVVMGSAGAGSGAGDAWFDDFKVEYYDPPAVITQPANETVSAGSTAAFAVAVSGTVNTYQWRKNGVNLANGGNVTGVTSASLTVGNAQAADAASYDVVISNGAGPVNSTNVLLLVAPAITTQPFSCTNLPATTATFYVAAAGQPTLSYQWRHDGTNIANGPNISGANADTLVLNSVNQTFAGSYSVVVTNAAGSVTSGTAMLVALELPTITAQPADQSVATGANVTFTVNVSGTAPFYYQWSFDDITIPGATLSSYTRLNVQSADTGNYSVQVTNVAGSVLSLDAVLALTNPQLNASLDVPGQTFILSWAAVNGKTYRVQYKQNLEDANWTDLPPDVIASADTASATDTLGATQRFYRVIALN